MNALHEIKKRFTGIISKHAEDPSELLAMIRPAQDSRFGDYQANFAMPLGKRTGKSPRDVATELVQQFDLDGLCQKVEVAGPGFINLTLDDNWLKQNLTAALKDSRLGVNKVATARNFVVDFSSPNVAKPLHVGHIRSTVIGDALSRILRFVGHNVTTDNHLGDWGTQFGMIIYGYRHFVDKKSYSEGAIEELGRLYRYVRKLIEYQSNKQKLPEAQTLLEKQRAALEKITADSPADDKAAKKQRKDIGRLKEKIGAQSTLIETIEEKIAAIESDPSMLASAQAHPEIGQAVLIETAKLHDGDEENLSLWKEFLPVCRQDIQKLYGRLAIEFDHEHGESFYHDQLKGVVTDFMAKGFARESDGAMCVFMEGYDTPMIIQKSDGAYLYSTTDLATIKYRIENWASEAVLYVVDHRQHQHFEKLFDAAKLWGYGNVELNHVSFGTVLGDDGRPFQTRAGDTVGLAGLLDEAESRALEVARELNPSLEESRLDNISKVVGIGALKYADLSQNRSSDYKFSYDKMLSLKGNTATYLQYGYARVQGIVRKVIGESEAEVSAFESLIATSPVEFIFENDVERQMAIRILQFGEALDDVLVEYKPNLLCNYLFDLAQTFGRFFDSCSVKEAGSESLQKSRLQLCVLTGRTIKLGLSLLGIEVLDRM